MKLATYRVGVKPAAFGLHWIGAEPDEVLFRALLPLSSIDVSGARLEESSADDGASANYLPSEVIDAIAAELACDRPVAPCTDPRGYMRRYEAARAVLQGVTVPNASDGFRESRRGLVYSLACFAVRGLALSPEDFGNLLSDVAEARTVAKGVVSRGLFEPDEIGSDLDAVAEREAAQTAARLRVEKQKEAAKQKRVVLG